MTADEWDGSRGQLQRNLFGDLLAYHQTAFADHVVNATAQEVDR
jgi:hypothetical protein